jgi:uncharacterized LabA/DUF88 family protein
MSEYGAPVPLLARYAVMVDVGYIFAAAGELLLGTSSRRDFRVDAVPLIQAISKHADELVRGELLRVYWYDAARDRVPTIDQRVIAQLPQVKLRLGNLNARGQQKGVDAQIRADMEALARHRAITDAVLVAGDEDMVPAVEAAQAYGVRVHLWGIEPPYGTNQAERLVWESDTVEVLESSFVRPFFTRQAGSESAKAEDTAVVPSPAELFGDRTPPRPPSKPPHPAYPVPGVPAPGSAVPAGASPPVEPLTEPINGAPTPALGSAPGSSPGAALGASSGETASSPLGGETAPRLGPDRDRVEEAGEHVAQKWLLTRGTDNIRDLLPGPILPPVIDKELLVEAEKELDLSLRAYQEAREWLRDAFWRRLHREFGLRP